MIKKIDAILRVLYYSLFFFTPLVMTSVTSELFEFNKMLFIYLIAVLVGFFWFLKMLLAKKIIIKKTAFNIPLILFLVVISISTIFSIDVHTSVFGYYGRFNGGLISIIAYIFLFFGFASNFDFPAVKKLLKISLLSSLLVILWGLPGRFGHDLSCLLFVGQFNNACWTAQFHPDVREFSTLGQPNWLGAYLAINFFIGLYFLLTSWDRDEKKVQFKNYSLNRSTFIYLLYTFLNFSTILFTRSRSALLAVLMSLAILFFLKYSKRMLYVVAILAFSVLIFRTGITKVDQFLDPSYYINKVFKPKISVSPKAASGNILLTSGEATDSFKIREIVWQGAIQLAKDYPLLGTGPETFGYSYYFVRPKAHNLTSEWDFLYNKAHNEFLNYAATTGFTGLGTYLLIIAATFWYGIKKIKAVDSLFIICLLLSYLTILITNFFGFSTTTINLFFFIIPGMLFISHEKKLEESKRREIVAKNETGKKRWLQIAGIILLSLVTVYFIVYIFLYFFADFNYARSDSYIGNNDYQQAANSLSTALKLRYEHVYEDKLSSVLANLAFIASYQKQTDVAQKLVALADYYNKKSISASPKNVLYWKTRAKNEFLFYQISLNNSSLEAGIKALMEAAKLSPTDPKIPYSESLFYSLMYDGTKDEEQKKVFAVDSLDQINQSINLKPDYRDAYFLKGQLLVKFGNKDEARKVFEIILQKISPNDQEVEKELQSL